MSSPRDADANPLSKIVVVWSTALSPHARQSKYDAFLCIIPDNLQKYWDHTFDGNGSIRSTFSTSVDNAYVEMMRIINTYSRKNTYAFSNCQLQSRPKPISETIQVPCRVNRTDSRKGYQQQTTGCSDEG